MAAHPLLLDSDLQERIERAAVREVRSPEFLLRDAVELYLSVHGEAGEEAPSQVTQGTIGDAFERSARTGEQSLLEADEAWEHYKRTGLHVTWDEVDAWLARLQAGEKVPPPECHA